MQNGNGRGVSNSTQVVERDSIYNLETDDLQPYLGIRESRMRSPTSLQPHHDTLLRLYSCRCIISALASVAVQCAWCTVGWNAMEWRALGRIYLETHIDHIVDTFVDCIGTGTEHLPF